MPAELPPSPAPDVVYQIFPDRFAVGGGLSSEAKLRAPAYGAARGAASPAFQFHGGDLDGITEHLDHVAGLGATWLYLTPIFTAPSCHKYDATDFHHVDPMFGGDGALDRLLAAAHARGLKVMLDMVLNHVSDRHPWFLAALDDDPRFRPFFTFLPGGGYACWKGHPHLPELDLAREEVRDVLYRREDSVVQRWLARGVDGWRFDVAQDVGLAVAEELAGIVRARFPEAWLVGEVFGFGGAWTKTGRGFHGTMNYYHRTAVLSWLEGAIDAAQAARAVADLREGCGLQGLLRSWNMLGSHDTPRLRTVLPDRRLERLALLAQVALPGVPFLYYGDEVGMEGGPDPDNRRPMAWDPALWDLERLELTRRLLALRRASPALGRGEATVLGPLPGNALAVLRHTKNPGEAALALLNAGEGPVRGRLLLPYSHWYDDVPLRDALGSDFETQVKAGAVDVEVPGRSGLLLEAFEPMGNYRFFKARNRS